MKEDYRIIYKSHSKRKLILVFTLGLITGVIVTFVIISLGIA